MTTITRLRRASIPLSAPLHPSPTVVIVGGGLGGLSAAIHLRLAGRRVVVFEANDQLGGRANQIRRDGFTFDTGPSLLNYPWVFEQLFEAAGRRMSDYVPLLAVDPGITFHWPDGTRLPLSSDVRSLLESFESVEPGVRPGALRFLADNAAKYRLAFYKLVSRNADGLIDWLRPLRLAELRQLAIWRSLDGELGRYFRSPRIREALGAYAMYLGGSPHALPGFYSILPYGEIALGLWLPRGGVYGLVEGIARLAREIGVEIHTSTPVRRIVVQHRAVTGVELHDGRFVPAGSVVSNVDVPTTMTRLLARGDAPLASVRRTRRTRMTPGVITFYWGLRRRLEGIGHHSIFFPDDVRGAFDELFTGRRIPAELPFYVSIPSETDPSLAPDGGSSVFILVPTPVLSDLAGADWTALVADVERRVRARLAREGVPIDDADIVVREVMTPEDWAERFGLHDGSAFGADHAFTQIGPFREPNRVKEIEGLYLVGASTTPGTGMPMVVLGGRLVAERVVEDGAKWSAP